jgi:molybdopterin synthase sulfur carrier subunit
MMKLKLLFFASHREALGAASKAFEIPEGATVKDLFDALAAKHPALKGLEERTIIAVNRDQADWALRLKDGDEVAFYPPVSGG